MNADSSPTISIVTCSYNSAGTISSTLDSIAAQRYPAIEHLIIDGASTDATLDIVRRFPHVSLVLSEHDSGLYDAMNKGIQRATGDVIGILNSDDFYVGSQVLEKVMALFRDCDIDALFADLVYVRPDNLERVVRYYSGKGFTPEKFAWGWMPPHPTFFVKREIYERYGLFRTDYAIAADFELTARFLSSHKIRFAYLPEVVVKMRTGGLSTRNLRSNVVLNREIVRACKENGISTNIFKIYFKYLRKILQLVARPT